MKNLLGLAILILFSATTLGVSPASQRPAGDFASLRAQATALEERGSFELARQAWSQAREVALSPEERRLAELKVADTAWRSADGTQSSDPTVFEASEKALVDLQRERVRPDERDELWALAEESLADFYWVRRSARNFSSAWPHYQAALDWWAGARDVARARDRYLGMVWRMASPDRDGWDGRYWIGQVPTEVLVNAVRIAATPEDRARARFLYGMSVRARGGDWGAVQRGFAALEAVIEAGKSGPWYDDALFTLAQWYEQSGRPDVDENGVWRTEPDFSRALDLYSRYAREFKKGDAPQHDQVTEAIERILRRDVGVYVASAFLPGSEIGYGLSWRNVERVDLALYSVDLTRDVTFAGGLFKRNESSASEWLSTIPLTRIEELAKWTHETKDDGRHRPGGAELVLQKKLAPGAYVIEATAGRTTAREIILVSSSSLVVKASNDKVVAWFCDALTSAPIAGARVRLWERTYDGSRWQWRSSELTTGDDGTVVAELSRKQERAELFVAAAKGEQTAFSLGWGSYVQSSREPWKVYAFTDRSTYRPGDSVNWKITARRSVDGKYVTPSAEKVAYEIQDSRGTSVQKGELTLNRFGSAWSELATHAELPLGEFHIAFYTGGEKNRTSIGGATLFRLEEYKLPEFEVRVSTPEENEKPKLFRTGDRVEVLVDAQYYYGAPVANADVEAVVYQRPYWRRWFEPRAYPWLYGSADDDSYGRFSGQGSIVQRTTIRTDARGKAIVAFDSPASTGQEFEYTIEARVTDASRREVTSSGRVRVTERAYAVNARADHKLYRPGDTIELVFQALDANEKPVEVEGRVVVAKERWVEIWIDPDGIERSGDDLENARARDRAFPGPGWKLKFRGYEREEIRTSQLETDPSGEARLSFAAPSDGFFTGTWTSRDDRKRAITARVGVWVVKGDTRETGYRSSGIELVLDRSTFRAGESAPVMISTLWSNRWVLLTIEGERLHSHQVVHVEGTAKLVMISVTDEHIPNVFVSAWTTHGGEGYMDVQEVVVPPVDKFLTVEVTATPSEILPGGKGTLNVLARDSHGEPVSAEIGLSLVDEAVSAIQGDYAQDPRRFFYGEKRGHWIQTHSSFESKRLARYALGDDGRLHDVRQARVGDEEQDAFGRGSRSNEHKLLAKKEGRQDARSEIGAAGPSAPGALGSVSDSAAAPAAAGRDFDASEAAPGSMAVVVRSDFRETAIWKPDLVTDASGRASVDVDYPESLTRWKAMARVAATDARFGVASAASRTQKPLVARLQAPRFFVVGDEVVISGVIDNRTPEPMVVRCMLEAEGLSRVGSGEVTVEIPAEGEERVDWKVRAVDAGRAKLRLTARGAVHSDGMEKPYVVVPHGIESLVARSLKLEDGELRCTLDVPAARRTDTTRFTVQVAPSLAVTLLDALPYLIDYPYGCTEQTLSRFLPAAIVAKTLKDRGLSAEEAMRRAFGGIEPETAGATHPNGKRSLDLLDDMVRRGLDRLYDMQHSDGGFGWWKEGDSDHYMSAYVVWGLSLARDAGLDVSSAVLERAAHYLSVEIVEEEAATDLAAWMLHALAAWSPDIAGDKRAQAAFDNLWSKKDGLNAYSRALFALAAGRMGRENEALVLVENLANGVKRDLAPDRSAMVPGASSHHESALATAHWGEDRIWWRWSDGGVEATAFALRALCAIDPEHALIEPVTNWLVQNRRGAQWSNTRDTAIVILALNEYLAASGELAREVGYELKVNDSSVGRAQLTRADMLRAPGSFTIPADKVRDGANEIVLVRTSGDGPLYLSARAEFFSLEEPIPPRGNSIFVTRDYSKLSARPTLLKGVVYDKAPLADLGHVASGDRVEVVLTIESKNNFEYLVFEDQKPAGLEAVDVQSGGYMVARELKAGEVERRKIAVGPAGTDPEDSRAYTGRQQGVHQELRDRNVALFLDRLPEGVWEVRYALRAETPGSFHALPAIGHAMYVPEIRCNGSELRVTVDERGPDGE